MKKKKTAVVAVLAAFFVTALGLAAAVYAKYVSTLKKNGTATVAKWDFKGENESSVATCSLTSTVASGTVTSGLIAPGTSGVCTIVLSNTHSEVAVDYTITLVDDELENIPTNLQLSSDGTNYGALTGFTKTGSLAIGTANSQVNIYWQWPYETGTDADSIAAGDGYDTEDGEDAYAGNNGMKLVFNIKGVQHNPAQAM